MTKVPDRATLIAARKAHQRKLAVQASRREVVFAEAPSTTALVRGSDADDRIQAQRCLALWAAVVRQAIQDTRIPGTRRAATEWLTTRGYPLHYICDQLGWDFDRVAAYMVSTNFRREKGAFDDPRRESEGQG